MPERSPHRRRALVQATVSAWRHVLLSTTATLACAALLAAHAAAAGRPEPRELRLPSLGAETHERGQMRLVLSMFALPASESAAAAAGADSIELAISRFLAALAKRDCRQVLTRVQTEDLNLGSRPAEDWCAALFASFERFGSFTADSYGVVSGMAVVPLRPARPNADWRLLTFRRDDKRGWLFSEKQAPGSLVPLVASAIRAQTWPASAATRLTAPVREALIEDNGSLGRVILRLPVLSGREALRPASSMATLLDFYRRCTSPEGVQAPSLGRYLDCLAPPVRTRLDEELRKADAPKQAAIFEATTAERVVDFVIADGDAAGIFYTEAKANRPWRDIVVVRPEGLVLGNTMRGNALDGTLNQSRVRAAIQAAIPAN